MIRFALPWVFWLEIPLLLLGVEVLRRQFAAIARIRENVCPTAVGRLTAYSPRRAWVHQGFLFLLGQCLILAGAGPHRPAGLEAQPPNGVVIALDASLSMFADDAGPNPATGKRFRNRFEQGRAFALALLDALPDTPFGLVSFSGAGVLHAPPTTDHTALRELLSALTTHASNTSGSDFTKAFEIALHLAQRERKPYRLVLIGDGELPRKLSFDDGLAVLAKNGIRVDTVGVGSESGKWVKIFDPEDVRRGKSAPAVVREVYSSRSDETLERIADRTGGGYYPLDGSRWVKELAVELRAATLAPATNGTETGDLAFWPLVLFLVGFLIETLFIAAGEGTRRGRKEA